MMERAYNTELLTCKTKLIHIPVGNQAKDSSKGESRGGIKLTISGPHQCLRNIIHRGISHFLDPDDKHRFRTLTLKKCAGRMDCEGAGPAGRLDTECRRGV